jgi:hypothetical protein
MREQGWRSFLQTFSPASAQRAIVAAIIAALLVIWFPRITPSPVDSDNVVTLSMGINLAHHGVMSQRELEPTHPSNYREPFPAVAVAAAVVIVDAFLGKGAFQEYFSGNRLKYLKYINILWLILLWFSAFAATRHFTGSFCLAVFGASCAVTIFSSQSRMVGVNELATELPAAFLLILSSFMLALALSGRSMLRFGIAGLCFGLLTLTKAAFLYVVLGMVAVLVPIYLLSKGRALRTRLLAVVLFGFSFAIVVIPWMYRNNQQLGYFQVASRGGGILYSRALLNQVTPQEYRGSFYVWAGPGLRPLIGSVLGFSPADVERGGRLQRLNDGPSSFYEEDRAAELSGRPEDALTYYRLPRAERIKLLKEFENAGSPEPMLAAEDVLQGRGLKMIAEDPVADLKMVLPLLWRSAPVTFPLLVIALGYSLAVRRYDFAIFVSPALAMVGFYAVLATFVPRYSTPAFPTASVAAVVIFHAWWNSAAAIPAVVRAAERGRLEFIRAICAAHTRAQARDSR